MARKTFEFLILNEYGDIYERVTSYEVAQELITKISDESEDVDGWQIAQIVATVDHPPAKRPPIRFEESFG